ncbi:hypothetical protein SLEP1_g54528 [Rubroshorea leprosula]|uniref:Reverse transcriptase Ty1/copia-type domain-containing protein n=1 Tax=Rubroshorea leprosula TaxID=152421 RepID=A0AAV5MCP3_9ROSI|nr:hypothetical protein SLEP1_g54528 [Rubroshorea leprosula]
MSSIDQHPLFTNPSIELFPNDLDADTFDELYDASPHAPPGSIEDVLPVGNALDNAEFSSLTSSISPIRFNHVNLEPKNEILNPPSSHRTRVRNPSSYLCDYHCFPAITSLHEPQSYQKASSNPRWQQGFTQEYGIDYEETFALVARPTSVRSLIVIVVAKRWKLFQMDVKNAFLNGDLAEEVYMKSPPGLKHPPNKVCRLKQALYGLKKAPRPWFANFSTTISEFGFMSSVHDTVLLIRKTNHGMVLLLLYVDDMIITRDDISSIHDLKQFLNHKFEMKDLGILSYFLGLEVTFYDDGYLFSQTKYAFDLISKAGLTDSKTTSTPFEPNVRLTSMDGSPLADPTRYKQLKQTVPSRSSTEAEYRALGDTTSKLLNLCWLLEDMGVSQLPATNFYCDNQNAMQIARNDVFHERTKHIEVDCHFVPHHVA